MTFDSDDDFGPTSHSFVSQRLRLNYVDWGNPTKPTLILVHGGQDHARSWDRVARALRNDWHVICPDLRGHGDSSWSPDGAYAIPYHVADLAQLIEQQGDRPVSIVAHSWGGAVSVRYAGIYPERVRRLVAIEGIGWGNLIGEVPPVHERWRIWIEARRALSARTPKRYATLEDAYARMREQNGFLSEEQARQLTIHGISRNEDGSWSWKFDNYTRSPGPVDISDVELQQLWGRIECPVLLVHGKDSWATNPADDGRAAYFRDSQVLSLEQAGHWVHHDRFDTFVAALRTFL